MLAFDTQYLGKYGIKTTDITGYIINSAQMTTHFNVLAERGINPKRIIVDDAAPVYFIDENTIFPNIFVIVSDNDMACRLEQNLMFLKTLEMLGCPSEKVTYKLMKGFGHCKYDGNEDFTETLNDYMNSIQESLLHNKRDYEVNYDNITYQTGTDYVYPCCGRLPVLPR